MKSFFPFVSQTQLLRSWVNLIGVAIFCFFLAPVSAQQQDCPAFTTEPAEYLDWELEHLYQTGNSGGQYVNTPRYPGKRDNASYTIGHNGDLWLYGGVGKEGFDSSSYMFSLADLWKYNTVSQSWTFYPMPGQSGGAVAQKAPNYTGPGAKHPGSRYGAAMWVDARGDLWLFGGTNSISSIYGDLWRFDVVSASWEWVKNDPQQTPETVINNSSVFTGDTVYPGASVYSSATKDKDGNFWLWKGKSYGILRPELWKFNPVTRIWTYYPYPGQFENPVPHPIPGVYKGENQYPGFRYYSALWSDTEGHLWLFGGYGTGETRSLGQLNDLWKFNVTTEKWEPKYHPNLVSESGQMSLYHTGYYTGDDLLPPNKMSAHYGTTKDGKFVIFAGLSSRLSSVNPTDFWIFDPVTEKWDIKKFKNNPFPIIGSEAATIRPDYLAPGWRIDGASWIYDDTFYLFSGRSSVDKISDLWKTSLTEKSINLRVNEGETVEHTPSVEGEGTLTIDTMPSKGTASVTPGPNQKIIYTSTVGSFGTDSFKVKLASPGCPDMVREVKVSIAKQNPCTEVANIVRAVSAGGNNNLIHLPNTELLPSNYHVIITSQPTLGKVTVGEGGAVLYKPNQSFGIDTFSYKIVTDTCESAEGTVTVHIGTYITSAIDTWGLYN